MEKIMRKRIEDIRKIKKEQDLSNEGILDIVYSYGKSISKKTLSNIIADGSEDGSFRCSSILDVYEALIDKYGDPDSPTEDIAVLQYKIKTKNRELDRLLLEYEEHEKEFKEKIRLYNERKTAYEKTISILEKQLEHQAEIINKLLEK